MGYGIYYRVTRISRNTKKVKLYYTNTTRLSVQDYLSIANALEQVIFDTRLQLEVKIDCLLLLALGLATYFIFLKVLL